MQVLVVADCHTSKNAMLYYLSRQVDMKSQTETSLVDDTQGMLTAGLLELK